MRITAVSGLVLVTAFVTPVFVAPQGPLVINYWGTVSGETFSGTVDLGGVAQAPYAQAPYTGVRDKTPVRPVDPQHRRCRA